MNETMSLLLATTVLALGGLGLYMFKSRDEDDEDYNEDYNEDGLFSSFGWNKDNDDHNVKDYSDDESEDYKPRKRTAKTQKNRKATGSSRRRY